MLKNVVELLKYNYHFDMRNFYTHKLESLKRGYKLQNVLEFLESLLNGDSCHVIEF